MSHTLEGRIAAIFAMSEEVWARHANPWSVWTRFTALPMLILAIWSRVWIDQLAWGATILALAWIWLNPRIFSKPPSTDNWASKAVLGERVWMNRRRVPVPVPHRLAPKLLSVVSGLGVPFLGWGLVRLEIWPLVLGTVLVYVGKVWFLDRMVWLYEDMKEATPEYAGWLYSADRGVR